MTTSTLAVIYECSDCGERSTDRRCPDCNLFTRRLGNGGNCPNCDEPVLVEELVNPTHHAPSHTENLTGPPLAALGPAFPATTTVDRQVTAQALVHFRGNTYSVPPGLAGATVRVSHRLGTPTLDIVSSGNGSPGRAAGAAVTVLARHDRAVDGAGISVRDPGHVRALQTAVLAAFSDGPRCAGKVRRPPTPAALAHADQLRGSGSGSEGAEREVVVDLSVWAQAARLRQVAP